MRDPVGLRAGETLVLVSLDTEEDSWRPNRGGGSVQNIDELLRLARRFERWGVPATYFTAHQVARHPGAAHVLREISAGGRAEIGAHLHPWNTPPLTETFTPRNTMLKNLPAHLQLAKLERLTNTLTEAFATRPQVFRAGRYGLGRETVAALLRCGYAVDSSVCPFISWDAMDEGPNFVGAPLVPYRLSPDRDVREPSPGGELLEIPLSHGFNRGPFAVWAVVRRACEARPLRWLHLGGLAARTGLVSRIVLSPELASATEMLTLSRRLLEHGVRHLQLSWHSPSLTPGLSPFASTPADVARLYASVEDYLDGLHKLTRVRFTTTSEAAALLRSDAATLEPDASTADLP
jgi:hypothetical protein